MKYDIAFPNLGIFIENLKNNIQIGGFTIAFYGIIIAIAMMLGFFLVLLLAKKSGQNTDNYYDLFILVIIFSIIGARAYYVIFNWDYYQIRPSQILNIRAGGLAVYGGIIASLFVLLIFCFIKKLKFFQVADTGIVGLTLGQVIGRFGNFFNMEAFGTYTNNLFAMKMRYDLVDKNSVDMVMLQNMVDENGYSYIQAHPTFFYESALNLILLIILLIIFFKLKKFNGQVLATYFLGYGLIRFFVEGLRTDSLMIPNTNIRVSQALSIVIFVIGLLMYIVNILKTKNKNKKDKSNEVIKTDINTNTNSNVNIEKTTDNNSSNGISNSQNVTENNSDAHTVDINETTDKPGFTI